MTRRKKPACGTGKPEAGEQTKIPVSGDLWQRAKGAAMYLAVLAYPAPEEWPKRDRFLKAAQAWILKSCPRGWAKHLRKWRPRDVKAVMNHAFWRIDSRREKAANIAKNLIVSAAWSGQLESLLPSSIREAFGAHSAADTELVANAMHRVWAESLPILHLAAALPPDRTGRDLISDPSWVAESLGTAESWERFIRPFLTRHGCAAIHLLPSV